MAASNAVAEGATREETLEVPPDARGRRGRARRRVGHRRRPRPRVVAQRWHHAYHRRRGTATSRPSIVRALLRAHPDPRHRRGRRVAGRRAEQHDHTRSIPAASLERLWERRDINLRERTLWRLLYETAARADEVLRLNVEDLDIPAKRARTRSKGGDVDWLFFGSGGARLLPRLIAGRRTGPVFLSSLRPSPARAPAAGDICPLTGRARLSYRRAAELLVAQTGWTLHQFRHSALTHLAEDSVQLPLLMAKSRHRSLRTLQRYALKGAKTADLPWQLRRGRR